MVELKKYTKNISLVKKVKFLNISFCTKPLSTIQCNKTLCRDQLVPILLIGKIRPQRPLVSEYK